MHKLEILSTTSVFYKISSKILLFFPFYLDESVLTIFPNYLERIDIFPIFAAENNRASEYRVGLQFRREGFRGLFFRLYRGNCPIRYAPNILPKLFHCTKEKLFFVQTKAFIFQETQVCLGQSGVVQKGISLISKTWATS